MYKITIEKVTQNKKLVKGDWVIVDQRPYTNADMKDSFSGTSYEGKTKSVYGYLEDKEVEVDSTIKVLEQTVDDIDLVSVIKAINNIKG